MRLIHLFGFALFLPLLCASTIAHGEQKPYYLFHEPLSKEDFSALLQAVADGWNQGNARMAASCFAENATYSAPPSKGHVGRPALYEYFGGDKGRPLPMHMTWHHVVFDPDQQIGVGEYTFRYQIQTHGLVIVKISHGLISNWREYEAQSSLPWDSFVGDNKF